MRASEWLSLALGLAALPGILNAHPGKLDAYGCHIDEEAQEYHCHRAPDADDADQPRVFRHERVTTYSNRKHVATWPVVRGGDLFEAMLDSGEHATVRLYGIDAPENDQPGGKEAAKVLGGLLTGRKIELTITGRDREGRTTALVFVDGQSVNEALLAAGHAYVFDCRNTFCAEWEGLVEAARAGERGLWAGSDRIPPWEWRARRERDEEESATE